MSFKNDKMRSRHSPTNVSKVLDDSASAASVRRVQGKGTRGWFRAVLLVVVLFQTVALVKLGYDFRYSHERTFGQLEKDVKVAQELAEELELKLSESSLDALSHGTENAYQQEVLDLCERRLTQALTTERTTHNELEQCKVEAIKASAESKMPFSSPVWLAIGIPTVARKVDGEPIDYLTHTLMALERNLPASSHDPLWGRVRIVVVDNSNTEHSVFESNRKRLENNQHFVFVENSDAKGEERPVSLDPSSDKPGKRVRQQTLDVVFTLKEVHRLAKPQFYAFMEDDFELCANGLTAIQYVMNKATLYHGDWIAIRMSYGLNGIIIKGKDILPVATYFEGNVRRRPPDHLIVEWFAGETAFSKQHKNNRVNVGFRYNIFKHIGVKSTIRKAKFKHRNFPKCWEELLFPVVFEVEAFNPKECPEDDIWPCIFSQKKETCSYENCAALNQGMGTPTRLGFFANHDRDGVW